MVNQKIEISFGETYTHTKQKAKFQTDKNKEIRKILNSLKKRYGKLYKKLAEN